MPADKIMLSICDIHSTLLVPCGFRTLVKFLTLRFQTKFRYLNKFDSTTNTIKRFFLKLEHLPCKI